MNSEYFISDAYIESCHILIGCMLQDKQAAAEIILKMSQNDFIFESHRLIFNTATNLFNQDIEITPQTIGSKTSDDILKECKAMVDFTPSAVMWLDVWELVKNSAAIYHAREFIEQIKLDTSMFTDIQELRTKAETLVNILSNKKRKNVFDYNELQIEYIKNLGVPRKFIDFGIDKLNKTARCPKNGFVILAARPSVGKTAMALQFCRHLGEFCKVGFFSLETDRLTVMDRLNAASAGVALEKLQDGNLTPLEVEHIICAARKKLNFKIYEASGYTPEQIRSDIVKDRLDIVFIDYLQLIQNVNKKYSEYERVTYASTALKNIATELDVAVIALSQLNRNITKYEEPDQSDLRSSGQIEQDANVILFLYIPNDDELKNIDDIQNQDLLRWLKIAKAKEGTTGKFKMFFDGKYQKFTEGWDYFIEIDNEFDKVEQQTLGAG